VMSEDSRITPSVTSVVHFCCRRIPHFGPSLQAPFKEYLRAQKAKLHHKLGVGQASVWHELFVYCYFWL